MLSGPIRAGVAHAPLVVVEPDLELLLHAVRLGLHGRPPGRPKVEVGWRSLPINPDAENLKWTVYLQEVSQNVCRSP